MATDRPRIFFPNLDSLRFLAFLLVFFQHGLYNAFKSFEGESYLSDRLINFFLLGGGTGVQIFFVLSGFLITYLLLNELKTAGSIDLKKFYIRRTLRIWPLYYATVFFAFIIYPYLKSFIGIDSALCSRPWYYFTFLANFDSIHISQTCPGHSAMTQGIVWSVSIEEQFYIFWPLLFKLLPSSKHRLIFPSVIFACIAFRIYAEGEQWVLHFHTFAVMGDLAIGGFFAYLTIHNQKFLSRVKELRRKTIAFCYLLIFACYFFQDLIFVFPGAKIFDRLIFDFFWAFIIMEQCFAKNTLYPLGRNQHFSNLGKISYGLYMLHPIGILITDIALRVLRIDNNSFIILLTGGFVSLGLSILIAKLSYKWLESPFLKLKDRFAIVKTGRQ